MSIWRQRLTKSLHKTRSQPESRYIQLATVDSAGRPHCRTVVFRGMPDENTLIIISDTRSKKWSHLKEAPRAEVCWYFTKTREQYRFAAASCLHTPQSNQLLINEQWERLSDAGKKQFLWGSPRAARDPASALKAEGDFVFPPPHFCVITLAVDEVDYLNLRGNPQERELHTMDASGQWQCQPVIP